ncbi:hypothetical protein GJW-30_1_04029 [Variibacter gotjawalensis]|uniref:HTH luxR-type domain-containing protein n=1 Tax=Variibacter gotjawalensis TaxID=1333996 RepID=A0A0S3Q0H7_9BRAD|nr:helix-turn-helix transcriptional regulator [Variibacter gotjawalensis]NIK47312.1 DNA-binding CsgD family transcriptional regulator [Variibacter gotjawalensis]RZS49210.1 DNA-binding CsgD family transcriptional regulator [Variibacter gotjawalensis]BAT61472.1 hypothetical protein GJW-30_1_04029 [Variibacter gotjawalensis]
MQLSQFLPDRKLVKHTPPADNIGTHEPFNLGRLMTRTLDMLSYGIVLIDCGMRPVFANKTAQEFLDQGRVDLSHNPTRHRRDPASDLRRLIVDCVVSGNSSLQTCQIGEPPLLCTVARLQTDGYADVVETCAILFLIDPEHSQESPHSLRSFGLTPAESGLAAEFAKGERLRDCARRLGIATSTARTHLHRIFDKTGASRQVDLMRLILTSTPALRCSRRNS